MGCKGSRVQISALRPIQTRAHRASHLPVIRKFWDALRGRRAPDKPAENRVDTLANQFHAEGRADRIEPALQGLAFDSLTAEEQHSWWHLFGIAAFQWG